MALLEVENFRGRAKLGFGFVIHRGFVKGSRRSGFKIVNVCGGKLIDEVFNVGKIVSSLRGVFLIWAPEISACAENNKFQITFPCLLVGVAFDVEVSAVFKKKR